MRLNLANEATRQLALRLFPQCRAMPIRLVRDYTGQLVPVYPIADDTPQLRELVIRVNSATA